MTRAAEVRAAFWLMWRDLHTVLELDRTAGKPKRFYGKSQNDLPCGVRTEFVDFVDMLAREGTISERLASTVTL